MASANPKLERRDLGLTGLKLSCIGFGASPLGNVFGAVSEDEANSAVRLAFSLGINFFDTSPSAPETLNPNLHHLNLSNLSFDWFRCFCRYYGGTLSEKVLGKALRALGAPREEFVVSTKCGRYVEGFDFSAERVTKSIDESLERLGLDYVDILQCHDIEFGDLDQVTWSYEI